MSTAPRWLTAGILRGPALLRRAAAARAREPEEAWMLRQPEEVRRSYVRDVLDLGGAAERQEIWMLRQPDEVRRSYVRDVLEPRLREREARDRVRRVDDRDAFS